MCIYIYKAVCFYYVLLRFDEVTLHMAKRNGAEVVYIYIYIYGAYAGAHPCVNDSLFPETTVKRIKPLLNQ